MVRRTKEDARATRERLLDAAELLFQAQGVSQTSLQQIAQHAGTTRGAIYWHFKDKADLFNAMMERVTLPMEASLRAAGESGASCPLALVEHGIVNALQAMTADAQVRRVFEIATYKVEYTPEMAAVQARHESGRQACLHGFEQALRQAARQGRMRLPIPAAMAAQGLHALLAGLMQDWLLAPHSFDLLPAGRRLLQIYLQGLGLGAPGNAPEAVSGGPATHGMQTQSAIMRSSSAAHAGSPGRAPERMPGRTSSRRISTDRIRPSEG